MISFAEKRVIQSTVLEQNKILSSNPSFANKRQAQKIKAEAMIKLGLVSASQQAPNAESEQSEEDKPIERKSTAHLYEFDPNRKPAQRKLPRSNQWREDRQYARPAARRNARLLPP